MVLFPCGRHKTSNNGRSESNFLVELCGSVLLKNQFNSVKIVTFESEYELDTFLKF